MISKVFVGSTAQDLGVYRRDVRDALQRVQVAVFLSEDWPGGYDDTVAKCHDELINSDGYFGIFAYWYGSIPPQRRRSITHLEFVWAKEKWGQAKYPLIAVFRPGRRHQMGGCQEPCEAEKELKAKAEDLLQKAPCEYRKKHAGLLEAFCNEVDSRDAWRTVQFFENVNDLREQAIVICLTWKGRLLALAGQASEQGSDLPEERQVSSAELGLLGRTKHLEVVETVISQLTDPKVPGGAMLIHGDEDSGEREFLDQLATRKLLRRGRPPQRGRPPLGCYDFQTLVQWVGKQIGDPATVDGPIEDLDLLAKAIHGSLQLQQVVLVLDQIWRYAGGVRGFHETFWVPLYEALALLLAQKATRHRLLVFVVDETRNADRWGNSVAQFDPDQDELDWSRLVLLLPLSNIKKSDVRSWLAKLEVPDEPPGRREAIVKSVLTNPAGEADGTPRRVLDRLRRESLWPEED